MAPISPAPRGVVCSDEAGDCGWDVCVELAGEGALSEPDLSEHFFGLLAFNFEYALLLRCFMTTELGSPAIVGV